MSDVAAALVGGVVAVAMVGLWCLPVSLKVTRKQFRLKVGACKPVYSLVTSE